MESSATGRRFGAPPLRTARLVSLALSWAFAVIAASVGLYAEITGERDKKRYMQLVPSSVRVEVDISDILVSGACATVASTFIGIFAFCSFICTFITTTTTTINVGTCILSVMGSLRTQAILLSIASLFLLASMIPYMIFFSTRSASVKAFIGGSLIPDSVVQSAAKSLGVNGEYKSVSYLKLVAIFPWFTLLAAFIAIVLLFAAATRISSHGVEEPVEKGKESGGEPWHNDIHENAETV